MPKTTICTAIPYVNSVPHIGTILDGLAADMLARYLRMRGEDVFFQMGTDENGLKIKEAAEKQGRDPYEFTAEIAQRFIDIFQALNFSYDDFVRTTEPRHKKASQALFAKLKEEGHVYLGKYEGWYDVSSETYYREEDLVDGKSPDGNDVRWVSEDNYFFRLSAFGDTLLEHIEKNPDWIRPENRKNEVIAFIKQGLRDISITRRNPGWGIEVPGEPDKVIYVWFDAVINYITVTGWPDAGWEEKWPAKVQWVGKDILTRFHATLWPAMLLGIGLPLFETVVAHGWVLFGGSKISKSKGEVVRPLELADSLAERAGIPREIAVDAVRHYLMATMSLESDSNFTYEDFDLRFNSDLANDLGNALNRSLAMAQKFVGGVVPDAPAEPEAQAAIESAKADYEKAIAVYDMARATDAAFGLIRFLNKYIDTRAPWALAKAQDPALGGVLRSMLQCLRAAEGLIRPSMPTAANCIAAQLGLLPLEDWAQVGAVDSLPAHSELNSPQPIFPRISEEREAAAWLLKTQQLDSITSVCHRIGGTEFDVIGEKDGVHLFIEVKRTLAQIRDLLPRLERQRELAETISDGKPSRVMVFSLDTKSLLTIEDLVKGLKKEMPKMQNSEPKPAKPEPKPAAAPAVAELIGIEDFMKVQLKVGRVFEAEPVEGSDKLLKLQVVIGEEKRQIVAGIRKNYSPEDLIGRQVIVCTNLKPAKLRGVESQGMLLAATDAENGAILLQPDKDAPEGTGVR